MKIFGKWMSGKLVLGAALAAATLGLGTGTAHAARIGVFVGVGAPVAYVPPCPGPGYAWVAGYWNPYRVWVPGYWNFVGPRVGVRFGGPVVVGRHFDHGFDRGYFHGRR
jgi:hypothetical protein